MLNGSTCSFAKASYRQFILILSTLDPRLCRFTGRYEDGLYFSFKRRSNIRFDLHSLHNKQNLVRITTSPGETFSAKVVPMIGDLMTRSLVEVTDESCVTYGWMPADLGPTRYSVTIDEGDASQHDRSAHCGHSSGG